MDGEDSATANPVEDISKWSVEDVCGFISSLAGCAEYTQVRMQGKREESERERGEDGGQGQAHHQEYGKNSGQDRIHTATFSEASHYV